MSDAQEEIRARLEGLREQHRELDAHIKELSSQASANQIQIQRLKKEKLRLKDLIVTLEDQLLPDIIA